MARRRRPGTAARLAATATLTVVAGCTPIVRYTEVLVEPTHGRTWFTRFPAALGGTVGFTVGIPVDIAALLPAWLVYRSQAKETRDPLSVFLFPSFVLWKVGVLFGAPFDLVEWAGYRVWLPARTLTQQEREAIEHEWDVRGNYPEYPVTPIHPPAPAGG